MRQIFPDAGPDLPVTAVTSDVPAPPGVAALADLYAYPDARGEPARPWVRANMISSADGAATLDGRSGGLSGPADRMVFAVLRSLADVILVGAGTARAERYRPVASSAVWAALRAGRPSAPRLAVVTARLGPDLDDLLLAPAAGGRTIALTTGSAPADRRAAVAAHADVIVAGSTTVDPAAAIGELTRLGLTRILVEGGPQLLGQLSAAGLVDELCLTLSPVIAGGHAIRITNAAADTSGTGLELAHVLVDDGQLICRYLRQPAGPG